MQARQWSLCVNYSKYIYIHNIFHARQQSNIGSGTPGLRVKYKIKQVVFHINNTLGFLTVLAHRGVLHDTGMHERTTYIHR